MSEDKQVLTNELKQALVNGHKIALGTSLTMVTNGIPPIEMVIAMHYMAMAAEEADNKLWELGGQLIKQTIPDLSEDNEHPKWTH